MDPGSRRSAWRTCFLTGSRREPLLESGKSEVCQVALPMRAWTRTLPKPWRGPTSASRSSATPRGRVMKCQDPGLSGSCSHRSPLKVCPTMRTWWQSGCGRMLGAVEVDVAVEAGFTGSRGWADEDVPGRRASCSRRPIDRVSAREPNSVNPRLACETIREAVDSRREHTGAQWTESPAASQYVDAGLVS